MTSINSFPFLSFPIAHSIISTAWGYLIESFLFGILNTKLIQLGMSTVFGDDVSHITLIFSVLYLIFYICKWEVPHLTLNYIEGFDVKKNVNTCAQRTMYPDIENKHKMKRNLAKTTVVIVYYAFPKERIS